MIDIDKAIAEQKTELTSEKFSVNIKDFLRGLIMAMGTAAFMVLQTSIDAGALIFQWKTVVMGALAGGVTYILKNYLQPQQVKKNVTPEEAKIIKAEITPEKAPK